MKIILKNVDVFLWINTLKGTVENNYRKTIDFLAISGGIINLLKFRLLLEAKFLK